MPTIIQPHQPVEATQAVRFGRSVKKVVTVSELLRGSSPANPASLSAEREAQLVDKFGELDVWALADVMRNEVRVRDRMYHFKIYPKCFVGFEGAKWMVKRGVAADIEEAVYLGNCLLTAGLIFHVCDDHEFKAEYLFYRFAVDETRAVEFDFADMEKLQQALRTNLPISDRKLHGKVQQNVFSGQEAVSYLVDTGICRNRGESIRLCSLLLHSDIFRALNGSDDFQDDEAMYRFADALGWQTPSSTDLFEDVRSNLSNVSSGPTSSSKFPLWRRLRTTSTASSKTYDQ